LYTVFNVEQTEGLPAHLYAVVEPRPLDDAIEDVQVFIERIGATVRHGGDRAFYAPALDVIQLPEPACFEGAGHYYSTSLHEHSHWSGHASRLDRDLTGRFGDAAYAAEELVAELGAAFLCVEMAVDLIRLRDQYDTIVLFSGDGDLVYALRYLKDEFGKAAYVFGARGHIGREVMDATKEGVVTRPLFADGFAARLDMDRFRAA
jgi:elongation factor P hydroxylase